ncbi:MAG: adenylate/guanylate cyclase domain-containing protein [Nonlabens sp.]
MKKIIRRRVLVLAISFAVIAIGQIAYDHLILISVLSNGTAPSYNFINVLLINIASGFFGGLVAGFTLNYIDSKFRGKPFYYGLAIIITMFLAVWAIQNIILAIEITESKELTFNWQVNAADIKDMMFWTFMVLLGYFFLQMSNKFGPGNLMPIFLGKYDKPFDEKRIFMLLDLKSSTTIAENLGNIEYHQFLKKIFSDVTNPIMDAGGEIYQYVGDEIVISWPVGKEKNHLKYAECFFSIQSFLESKKQNYLKDFGQEPVFKAGAHLGEVTAGEIGVIKRDITYSGDILNTAARIQGLCNELESKFLISDDLFRFSTGISDEYSINVLGTIPLRGKTENLQLIDVSKKNHYKYHSNRFQKK